jgi:DNA-binding transcriptional MocR family regulator
MTRFGNGYIKFYRSVVDEDIGWSGVQLAVWTTLLCWATRFETKIRWKGQQRLIPPGTVVTGVRELAKRLGFSKDSVARAFHALSSRDSIRVETSTRGTLITICNWSEYQEVTDSSATPLRHESKTGETTAGLQPDLIREVKNKRKKGTDSAATSRDWWKLPREIPG